MGGEIIQALHDNVLVSHCDFYGVPVAKTLGNGCAFHALPANIDEQLSAFTADPVRAPTPETHAIWTVLKARETVYDFVSYIMYI